MLDKIKEHLKISPSNQRHVNAIKYLLNTTYELVRYENQSGFFNSTEWQETSFPVLEQIVEVGIITGLVHTLIGVVPLRHRLRTVAE